MTEYVRVALDAVTVARGWPAFAMVARVQRAAENRRGGPVELVARHVQEGPMLSVVTFEVVSEPPPYSDTPDTNART